MANKVEKIRTFINTSFYDPEYSHKILRDNSKFKAELNDQQKSDELNDICKKISDKSINSASLQDEKRYFHIAFSDYLDFKRAEQDKLIFKIDNNNGKYYVSTGLYCGVINLDEKLPQIEISTGYSEYFFKRILNYCCGIYADINTTKTSEESESIYSLLVQYMYLISLRKIANKTFPKKYVLKTDRGYSVNGNVDIEAYINIDITSYDKKITYNYPVRQEIQPIVDVLNAALESCKISKRGSILPSVTNLKNYFKENCSGKKPSRKMITNIQKEKCLQNSLYADFKKPLEYARILLDNHELNSGNTSSVSGISGFFVDASFLWEMYLYNLMKINLPEWNVEAQCELSFYEDTFYSKKNYPDFVLTNKTNGDLFILDAKFKRMKFENVDVDNKDLQQLHSYSYYFHLKYGDQFKGSGLIYPSKIEQTDINKNISSMFGIKDSQDKFGVFYVKDPSDNETMTQSEDKFLSLLKLYLKA